MALIYEPVYAAKAVAVAVSWGLLIFIGLGIIAYALIIIWWATRSRGKGWLGHLARPAGFFVYFIVIVTLRKLAETAWGDDAANAIGISIELTGIALLALILAGKKD